MAKSKYGTCPTCNRRTHLTFHHLIPRKVHKRRHFKKKFSKDQLNQGVNLCRTCHSGIHTRFSEITLAKELNTLTALQKNEECIKFFSWVSKQRIR